MAGSVSNKEYDVTMQVKTNHYAEEVEDVIREALEEAGISIVNIKVSQD